jgi:uncharacterized iron-regulated membrane protein
MNRHSLARFIRRWHARLGITAALFFMVLIVTGIALNHTERLSLAYTSIQSEALTRWYGLPAPQLLAVYEAEGEFIATPQVWLYQGHRLPEGGGPVIGVVRTPDMLVVATAQTLSLFTPTGERIDSLRGTALPHTPISGLGRTANAIVLKSPNGLFSSVDGIAWQAITTEETVWARAQTPDPRTLAHANKQLAPSLPLERIVLDLHSGRFFGSYGPFLMDAAALVLLVLSLSGVWIQWRSWRQKRRHPHKLNP